MTRSFEESDDMFEKYYSNRVKSSPTVPECDQACRTNIICGIRAGKSELRCDYQRDDMNQTSLFSERQRDPAKFEYMKDLCSGLVH